MTLVAPLHTDKTYEKELSELREHILLMGARVEDMIRRAMQSFSNRDVALAESTIQMDLEIDQLEKTIDQRCLRVLARRQPVASDLRFITTALKVVTDLERIGDLAVNICERVVELGDHPQPAARQSLIQMGETSHAMVRDALDAFNDEDAGRAKQVIERDNVVDATYARLFPELLAHMVGEPERVYDAQRLQSVGKYLERIADHATNLAEMVVFMVRGEDPRHLH